MAIYSSILASEIPWTEEPGGLQSLGSQSVRHDSMTEQQQRFRPRHLQLDNVLTKARTQGRAGDEVGKEGQVTSALKVSKVMPRLCGGWSLTTPETWQKEKLHTPG